VVLSKPITARTTSSNRNLSARTPSRQLSWNTPASAQQASANSSNPIKVNRLKRRSKTQEDLNSNGGHVKLTPRIHVKAKVQTNNPRSVTTTPNGQSKTSRLQDQSSSASKVVTSYAKNDNSHKRIVAKKNIMTAKSPVKGQPPLPVSHAVVDILPVTRESGEVVLDEAVNEQPSAPTTPRLSESPRKRAIRRSISFVGQSIHDGSPRKQDLLRAGDKAVPVLPSNDDIEAVLMERLEKQEEVKAFLSNLNSRSPFKDSVHFQQQASEVQARIMRQREEMRLQREKNLKEFKSQLKRINQEKESVDFENSYYKRVVPAPANLTCKRRVVLF
jgi:hypothetical protein